ncbi:hypothetical protein DBR36_09840 [Microbacterium sp. HMWF026]|uniref:glycosyltransferase family 4 protein n=1 Tax=Microbacterium sp. HMWF026 TaxID=2056861 RepID=UPI000D354371|nr:hypothetical protein DBR36_09840 [Microbacterium sp. HMWF026]
MRLHVVVRSIAPSGGFGGLERSAADHVSEMRNAGIDVLVHAPLVSSTEGKRVDWPTMRRPRSLVQGVAYSAWVRRAASSLVENLRLGDVVHLHGSAAAAASMIPSSVPTVMNPHGLEEFDPMGLSTFAVRPILRHLSLTGARAVSRVVSTDSSITGALVKKLRIPESKVVLIPNSVDALALRSIAASHRSSDVWGDGGGSIVSVGRVEHNKGYDLLAAALAACSDLPWTWTHYGSGSQDEYLRRVLSDLSIKDRVRIVAGASDAEVQHAFSRAGLFVQPSRSEGSSLTTLEAMAHGAFILACAVGGIPDKITNGAEGLLTVPQLAVMSRDLRHAIGLVGSPAARKMGKSAMARVEKDFSSRSTAKSYVNLYQGLLVQ